MGGEKLRIAYLNSRYPSLSHTFIEREVRALRELGVELHTCSIRTPRAQDVLGATNKEAAQSTFYVLKSKWRVLIGALIGFVQHPIRAIRALWHGQKVSPPGVRARALHLIYAIEGIVLARRLNQDGIRHVHVHMANNGASVAMLACRYDPQLRYSLTIHGSEEFLDVKLVRLREKAESAEFVRCVSSFCRAQVMAWVKPKIWDRLHVVHCGIDPRRFAVKNHNANGPMRMIAVGRFDPIKGYPLLFEACARLDPDRVDWSLQLIGDGPVRAELEQEVKRLGIEHRVRMPGAVAIEELPRFLGESDIMVLSSFMEGLPIVLMEAMAAGLPVVATRIAGIPELVEEGKSGVLAQPGSVDELHAALKSAIEKRTQFQEMGQAGRSRVEQEFDIRSSAAALLELFHRYVGGR